MAKPILTNMKYIKHYGILLSLLTVTHLVSSQNIVSSATMMSVSPTWQWRCDSGEVLYNFNHAKILDGSHAITFDSIPYARDYTMVVAYKPLAGAETSIWKLNYVDSSLRGLTTEHIVSGSTKIRYADATGETPIINTLRQSAPDSISPHVSLALGGDTLSGSLKIAEILYFDQRLSNSKLRKVQSALAIRYGVTLGPVDYLDGDGRKIWKYADSGRYHHRVTGIGRDSTYNLYQPISRSEMEGSMLTISTDSIDEHAFLIIGDNDAPLTFVEDSGGTEILSRQWHTMATDMDNKSFSLIFDTRNIPMPTDSLVLLMDGYIIPPTAVLSNEVRFDNIWLPSDTCTFTLARGSILWQIAQSTAHGSKGRNGGANHEDNLTFNMANSTFNVFPNPTTGHYTIEVTGAKQVQVTIYDVHGAVIETYTDNGKGNYVFNGNLPSGNSYYATITTENCSQTMKLVVK